MKKVLYLFAIAACTFSCKQQEEQVLLQEDTSRQIELSEINDAITSSLQETGRFDWSSLESNYISAASQAFDGIVTIGYQPANFQNLNTQLHTIDVNDEAWSKARTQILKEIEAVYTRMGIEPNMEERLVSFHETLPYFHIQASETTVIEHLRNLNVVRYTEPYTYEYVESGSGNNNYRIESGSGCGGEGSSINSADYTTVAPGSKVSWNYYKHNIPSAWAYSQGDNIGVGLIDTGVSSNQAKLGSQFSSDYSTGRSVYKYAKFVDSWWPWSTSTDGVHDKCGHGTAMAGAICAPRNNDGMAVGVAYKANLYSVRAAEDVVISSGHEKDGISDAYVLLGNKSGVKIISMSMGSPLSSGQVADAVRYAYGKGKLIFNAAGTSTSFTSWYPVIFPAWMSETVAVTGIKDNGYNKCEVCHDGSEVDFTVVMERASNTDRHSLTLPMSGTGVDYVGGSSVATAMTAGTAALIWARNPSASRTTILNKMKQAAEFYPNRNGSLGWGNIDVLEAVTSN
jgi:hypothetical protein